MEERPVKSISLGTETLKKNRMGKHIFRLRNDRNKRKSRRKRTLDKTLEKQFRSQIMKQKIREVVNH